MINATAFAPITAFGFMPLQNSTNSFIHGRFKAQVPQDARQCLGLLRKMVLLPRD
jgi:hypothetical protein